MCSSLERLFRAPGRAVAPHRKGCAVYAAAEARLSPRVPRSRGGTVLTISWPFLAPAPGCQACAREAHPPSSAPRAAPGHRAPCTEPRPPAAGGGGLSAPGAARAILARDGCGHMVTAPSAGSASTASPRRGPARCDRTLSPGGSRRSGPVCAQCRAGSGRGQWAPNPPEPAGRSGPAPSPQGPATPARRAGQAPSRGLADNGASTAGLVPGFLRRPAATRPLPGLAALSCGRSQAGRGTAGPGARGPGHTGTGAAEAKRGGGGGRGRASRTTLPGPLPVPERCHSPPRVAVAGEAGGRRRHPAGPEGVKRKGRAGPSHSLAGRFVSGRRRRRGAEQAAPARPPQGAVRMRRVRGAGPPNGSTHDAQHVIRAAARKMAAPGP